VDNKELKAWADTLLRQSMAYYKMSLAMRTRPNSAEMKTSLRYFPDDVLIREVQRRKALMKLPELKTDGEPVVEQKVLVNWIWDDTLVEECKYRDLDCLSLNTIAEFEAAIDTGNWEAITELLRGLI